MEFQDAEGTQFFHCVATGECTWERPTAHTRADDAAHGLGCELSPDAMRKIAELHQSGADLNEKLIVEVVLRREKLRRASAAKAPDETESPLHELAKPDPPPAARASVRRSAVAQTPRDQETGLGDIELREAGLHFDESAVYPARPSVFSGNQVAARGGRNLTLGSDE